MIPTSSYLLIDFGNSNVKAAIFNPKQNKIIETSFVSSTSSASKLLSSFDSIKRIKITKIFESVTAPDRLSVGFNNQLSQLTNCKIRKVKQNDFNKIVDSSICGPKTEIGSDILLLAYYASKHFSDAAIFSFGTVYFSLVMHNKKISSVYFLPNIITSLAKVAETTNIPSKDLPKTFDKNIGVSTNTAFSAGINLAIEGWINTIVKKFNIPSKQVLLSGGHHNLFTNVNKKYKRVKDLVLQALAEFVQFKKW